MMTMLLAATASVQFEQQPMNRRLEIDISSEHEESGPDHSEEEQEEEEQGEDGEEEQGGELEEEEEEQASQYSRCNERSSASPSRQDIFESVQTFGNQQPTSSDRRFVDRLLHGREASPSRLDETAIGQRACGGEHSSIEEEVARIIRKVRGRHAGGRAEERSRIGTVNKQLLKENTELIGEINQLESKLEALCSRNSKRGGEGSLSGKAQKYREKLSRAQALQSKLSSRLATEKSRSYAISSTFRSALNQASSSHITTLRSHVRADSNEMLRSHSKKPNNHSQKQEQEQAFCARCCKEMDEPSEKGASMRAKEGVGQRSKELIFSPVLQFKNYEIAGEKSSQLETRRISREVHCQVNFEETASLEQLRALQEEEKLLQASIDANATKIMEFEELLYQLVDLS